MQNTVRSFSEFGWMLAADDQEFVRKTVEHARDIASSEDPSEVRNTLEELERAGRLITDAMFRPTGLESGSGDESHDEEVTLS